MASQSAAVRRPPAPQPSLPESSAPAGGFARARVADGRRAAASGCGRSRGSHGRRRGGRSGAPPWSRRAVERVRPLRAGGANRVRRRLAELRGTAAVQDHGHHRFHAQDHHAQRFARHFLRPLDQSLSRLRARLHLLLRAADARLSRAVAGARFRIQAVRQARSAEAARTRTVGAGLRAAHHRHRHQHRSLPADRARSIRSCAASSKCSSATAIRSAS